MKQNTPQSRKPKEEYYNHVLGCRKYALMLANKYKADKFVIEVAALLHDTGADAGPVHAQESAKIAKDFLSKLNLDKNNQKKIIACITTHSMGPAPETLEQQIIQDADGLIFIEDTYKYFYLKYPDKNKTAQKTQGMMDKIRTEEGKSLANILLPKAMGWIKSQD